MRRPWRSQTVACNTTRSTSTEMRASESLLRGKICCVGGNAKGCQENDWPGDFKPHKPSRRFESSGCVPFCAWRTLDDELACNRMARTRKRFGAAPAKLKG